MRIRGFVFLLAIVLFCFLALLIGVEADQITGEVVTGEATSDDVGVSIAINDAEEEAAAPAAAAAGGGGGGGGGAVFSKGKFNVIPEEFNLILISGEREEKEIKVINTGSVVLDLEIEVSGIVDMAELDVNQLSLKPGEEKIVKLLVTAPGSGVYAGRVIFNSGDARKDVFVLINVRGSKALFDVSLTIPESQRTIGPGRNLKVFISLAQLGDAEEVDVTANYVIKDFDGNTLFTESETFRVFKTKDFVKEFSASELPVGDYVAGVEIVYPEGFASSSARFVVLGEVAFAFPDSKNRKPVIIILAVLVVVVILFAILKYKKSKRVNRKSKRVNKK